MPKRKRERSPEAIAKFEDVLGRIMDATCTRTQVQLADVLGVRQSSISDAKRRCSIPAEWKITLLIDWGLDPAWVMNGFGPQWRLLSDNPSEGAVSAAAIEREVSERLERELSANGIQEKFFEYSPRAVVVMSGPGAKLDENKLSQLSTVQ